MVGTRRISVSIGSGRALGVLALFAWSLLLRLPTFLRSVIDWDESLYVLIADAWRRGELPYVGLWDHKPVGVYLLFAWTMGALGRSLAAVRILTAVFAAASAVLIQALVRTCTGNRAAALAAAIAYPAFSITLHGVAANTEHFFTAFVLAGALLLALAHRRHWAGRDRAIAMCACGLLFGVALQVKYIAIFDIAFLVAIHVWVDGHARAGTTLSRALVEMLQLGAGMCVPTLLVGLYFWSRGHWAEFFDSNFLANLRHVGGTPSHALASGIRGMLKWAKWTGATWVVPVLAVAAARWRGVKVSLSPAEWALVAWIAVGLIEAGATTRFYLHYYIVTLPPTCMLAALLVTRSGAVWGQHPVRAGLALALAPVAIVGATRYRSWITERLSGHADETAQVAEFVQARVHGPETVFVVDDEPIIYFLAGLLPPTRYAFPPFLMEPHFSAVARVDYRREVERILGGAPRCVIIHKPWGNERADEVRERIASQYALERSFDRTADWTNVGTDVFCRP